MEIALPGLISCIVATAAIIVAVHSWQTTRHTASYADLDTLYLELLKVGLTYPRFTDPTLTKDYKNRFKGDELLSYKIYAFMSWNVCETIYDRCEKDKHLWCTWEPVIVAENNLHRRWFDDPENFHKFKKQFRQYIHANRTKEY